MICHGARSVCARFSYVGHHRTQDSRQKCLQCHVLTLENETTHHTCTLLKILPVAKIFHTSGSKQSSKHFTMAQNILIRPKHSCRSRSLEFSILSLYAIHILIILLFRDAAALTSSSLAGWQLSRKQSDVVTVGPGTATTGLKTFQILMRIARFRGRMRHRVT